jgi:hypothetical protein
LIHFSTVMTSGGCRLPRGRISTTHSIQVKPQDAKGFAGSFPLVRQPHRPHGPKPKIIAAVWPRRGWLHEGIPARPPETESLRPDQDGRIDRAATRLIDARERREQSRQTLAQARR